MYATGLSSLFCKQPLKKKTKINTKKYGTGLRNVPTPLRMYRRCALPVVEMDAKEQVGLGLRMEDCQANTTHINTEAVRYNTKELSWKKKTKRGDETSHVKKLVHARFIRQTHNHWTQRNRKKG